MGFFKPVLDFSLISVNDTMINIQSILEEAWSPKIYKQSDSSHSIGQFLKERNHESAEVDKHWCQKWVNDVLLIITVNIDSVTNQ